MLDLGIHVRQGYYFTILFSFCNRGKALGKVPRKYQGKARGKSGAEDRVSKFGAENVFNNVILNSTMNATMNLTNSDKGLKQNYLFSSGFLLL